VRSVIYSADIPFTRDDARRSLPALVACLVGFICLLLSFSISLSSQVSSVNRAAHASFQIEVPASLAQNTAKMDRISKTVKNTRGVSALHVINHANMQQLLKPWLGENLLLKTLGVPVLIDVSTHDNQAVNMAALRAVLKQIHAKITIQAHGPWQRDIARAAKLVHAFLLGLAVILIGCVVGIVALLARIGLKLHFKTVSLLHLFGATDDYILKQFQRNSAKLVARGALVGVGFAIIAFMMLIEALSASANPALPQLHISISHGVLWVLLPVAVSIMAMIAARFSVQRMLSTMH
jgi:cell division transport system permease protein